mgnify:CR=1 FL=1
MTYILYTAGEGKIIELLQDWETKDGTTYYIGDYLKLDTNYADFLIDILKIAKEVKE